MATKPLSLSSEWTAQWLDGVAAQPYTMSQRLLSSIEKNGGGIAAVTAAATERGLHLLLLEDEQGRPLVAASKTPFVTLC